MVFRNPHPPQDAGPYWPYDHRPRTVTTEGPWQMGMSAGGSMVMWPSNEPLPDELGVLPAFRGEKDQLEQFITTFCMLGYETDPKYVHQDGRVWLFNWISGTLAQISIAGQAAQRLFSGDYDGAWEVGHRFQRDLEAAEKAEYDRRNPRTVDWGQSRAASPGMSEN